MKNKKVILKLNIVLALVAIILISAYRSSENNKLLMPVALICLGAIGIVNGIADCKNRNYILGLFFLIGGMITILLALSSIKDVFG